MAKQRSNTEAENRRPLCRGASLSARGHQLEAAHARIRLLEAEIARLQSQVDPVTEAYAEETAMLPARALPEFLAECGYQKSSDDWTNEDASAGQG